MNSPVGGDEGDGLIVAGSAGGSGTGGGPFREGLADVPEADWTHEEAMEQVSSWFWQLRQPRLRRLTVGTGALRLTGGRRVISH